MKVLLELESASVWRAQHSPNDFFHPQSSVEEAGRIILGKNFN
jgi:hypothetical protein